MNPYSLFATDKNLETGEGLKLEYDGFSIIIHRAGGGNRKYQSVFATKMAPHRRKFDMGTLDQDVIKRVLAETYADTVIIGWTNVKGPDGQALEFNKENVVQLLLDLPDLFDDIIEASTNAKNFRKAAIEEDSKN